MSSTQCGRWEMELNSNGHHDVFLSHDCADTNMTLDVIICAYLGWIVDL
jgi:hypothetical protein